MSSSDPPGPHPSPRSKSAPGSPPVRLVAVVVLGLTLLALVSDRRRVRTGELRIQADESDIQVLIRHGDRLIERATHKRSFTLAPGQYDVEIADNPPGWNVEPARVEVVRGKRSVVRVARVPTAPPVPPPAPVTVPSAGEKEVIPPTPTRPAPNSNPPG
jgi:hypothetical protein